MKNIFLFTALLPVFSILAMLCDVEKSSAQDSNQVKILIVKSAKEASWFSPPTYAGFKKGYTVKVVYRKNYSVLGRIQQISDSSIHIKDLEIKLSDINRIQKVRGRYLSGIAGGLTLIGLSLTVNFGKKSSDAHENYSDHSYEGAFLGSLASTVLTGIATLIGIIQYGSARNYNMDVDYKFDVKPDIFKNPGAVKFPSKQDTTFKKEFIPPSGNMNLPFPKFKKNKKVTDSL